MIRGIVSAVPSNRVTNDDLAFIAATHVKERRVTDGPDTAILGSTAAQTLLSKLGWQTNSITNLICVTQTPPVRMPATACSIAHSIGFQGPALDINLACSGYVYGLYLAYRLPGRTLIVAGDTVSRMVNPQDRATAMLFGDAVTATAWEWDTVCNPRFIMGTDGRGFDKLIADPAIRMDGAEVFGFALETVPSLVQDVTLNAHVDWHFFHQANGMMLKHLIRKCGIDSLKAPVNIERYGNTSSASIPLLMCDSTATPWLKAKQSKVGLYGFGAGFSWAGVMMSLEPLKVCEVIEV